MEEKKKSTYNGFTEARKAANARYLAKLAEIRLRMQPETKEDITAAAAAAGESVNQYMIEATRQRMERERG